MAEGSVVSSSTGPAGTGENYSLDTEDKMAAALSAALASRAAAEADVVEVGGDWIGRGNLPVNGGVYSCERMP